MKEHRVSNAVLFFVPELAYCYWRLRLLARAEAFLRSSDVTIPRPVVFSFQKPDRTQICSDPPSFSSPAFFFVLLHLPSIPIMPAATPTAKTTRFTSKRRRMD